MEKIIHSERFTKLLSLLIAIGLWFYVVYAENPEAEFWIHNIPISYVNTEQLSQNSLVLLHNDEIPQTISIKVKGRRRDTSLLSSSNISASVTLSDVFSAGTYSLPVNIRFPIDGLEVTDKSPYTIPVVVDNIVETTKNINANFTGTPPENHSPGEAVITPATVRISGPSSVVSTITSAVATVDISNASDDIATTVSVSLMSSDGTVYAGDDITIYNERVDVSVPILLTKSVPVVPVITNQNDFDIASVTVVPETAVIKGTPSVINATDEIKTSPLTITEASSPISIPASLVLPEGALPADDTAEYTVEIILNSQNTENEVIENE